MESLCYFTMWDWMEPPLPRPKVYFCFYWEQPWAGDSEDSSMVYFLCPHTLLDTGLLLLSVHIAHNWIFLCGPDNPRGKWLLLHNDSEMYNNVWMNILRPLLLWEETAPYILQSLYSDLSVWGVYSTFIQVQILDFICKVNTYWLSLMSRCMHVHVITVILWTGLVLICSGVISF